MCGSRVWPPQPGCNIGWVDNVGLLDSELDVDMVDRPGHVSFSQYRLYFDYECRLEQLAKEKTFSILERLPRHGSEWCVESNTVGILHRCDGKPLFNICLPRVPEFNGKKQQHCAD